MKKVPLNVNIVRQDLLHICRKPFLKILWSEVLKEGFQLMLILSLLVMDFDVVVVIVTNSSPYIQICSDHTVSGVFLPIMWPLKMFILVKYPAYYEIGIPIICDLWYLLFIHNVNVWLFFSLALIFLLHFIVKEVPKLKNLFF